MKYILAWYTELSCGPVVRVFIGDESEVVNKLFTLAAVCGGNWDDRDRREYLLELDVSNFDDIENYLTEDDLEGIEWDIFDMSGRPRYLL